MDPEGLTEKYEHLQTIETIRCIWIVLEIRVLHTVYQNQGCTSGSGLLHIYIYIRVVHQDQGCYILIHMYMNNTQPWFWYTVCRTLISRTIYTFVFTMDTVLYPQTTENM